MNDHKPARRCPEDEALLSRVARSAARESSQGHSPVQRSQEERELVEQAKLILIEYSGMTEAQAHRFLQRRSMNSGTRLADTARQVLEGNIIGQ